MLKNVKIKKFGLTNAESKLCVCHHVAGSFDWERAEKIKLEKLNTWAIENGITDIINIADNGTGLAVYYREAV